MLSIPVACDIGDAQLEPLGPKLQLQESSPRSAEGIDCEPADEGCGVPVNRPLYLRFDRPLLPSSATGDALRLYTGAAGIGSPFLFPDYDVLGRTLSYRIAGELEAGVLYRLELLLPSERGDAGLRAYDGAPLSDAGAPTTLSFFTSSSRLPAAPAVTFSSPTCDDVVALFAAHCASGCCHGGASPAMGLSLDSKSGLRQTAIARVAHETETGNTAGVTFEDPARFGVAMPIIDPGSSATSYLIYKLMLEEQNLAPCSSGNCSFDARARECVPLSGAERQRMAGWFVHGDAMPPRRSEGTQGCLPPAGALDCGATRAIARFIDSGALCP